MTPSSEIGDGAPGLRPVLLTSLTSAALLDGRGDLVLLRETRGATVDWGGVYGQLVRLTGPWRLALVVNGRAYSLPETRVAEEATPSGWVSRHRLDPLEVVQEIAAVDDPPGVVRRLTLTVASGPPLAVLVENSFEPFLLPPLVEGVRPTSFQVETSPEELRVRHRGFGLRLRATVLPSHLFVNRGSWLGGRREGPLEEIGSDHELRAAPGAPASIALLLSGGLERDLLARACPPDTVFDPDRASRRRSAADAQWRAATPELSFPDDPRLEEAYALARDALRRLYTAPGDGLVGLVAGYPWYATVWCRDLAWMLPAVLWLGDFDWAERAIGSVLRFQSVADVPILGGEPGEMPMQIAPGPIFLYGTSDTTLYYPTLIRQLVAHAGRPDLVQTWGPAVSRMIAWGRARCDPATGLLRNGGEAEAISNATASIARVRYGIDSPDTTIWDSADRRDHAIDVQVLWHDALRAATGLLADGSPGPSAEDCLEWADRVAGALRARYPWESEEYLYDTIRAGRPVGKLRPNAALAVSAGLLDAAGARRVVRRLAREDLTTPWGVRTLSNRDPEYDPHAYHDGQVWTIATAWAADAALAADERELGHRYLAQIADLIRAEGGFANECYRGDRAEPYDSCFVLGLSLGPFLTVLFKRLWGLTVDASPPHLTIRPAFPAAWRAASVARLRIGSGTVRLDWTPGQVTVAWTGPGTLRVETRAGDAPVTPGVPQSVPVPTGGAADEPSSEPS